MVYTVLAPPPRTLPSHERASLLPFSIGYSGPASISSYFDLASSGPSSSKEASGSRVTTFRGRWLHSHALELPAGYTGLLYRTQEPVDDLLSVEAREVTVTPRKRKAPSPKKVVVPKGKDGQDLRRSPRKKVKTVVVNKFSFDDSDDEDDDEVAKDEDNEEEQEQEGEQTEQEDTQAAALPTPAPSLVISTSVVSESVAASSPGPSNPMPTPAPSFSALDDFLTRDDEMETQQEDRRLMLPLATFSALDVWNPDIPLVDGAALEEQEVDDLYVSTISEWTRIAALIHEEDEDEENQDEENLD